jgi:peptidoglycan/xylan/chitin deacetylase (PgdA/CDA1 family)
VSGPRRSGSVCLTFDDGPHPEHTPRLLDVLKQAGVRATFFVIGERAASHPDLIRRLGADGHVVANHSFTHSEPSRTTAPKLLDEVDRTQELLDKLIGRTPALFRPPKGEVTASKLVRLWRAGQTVVLWNKDPKDYACRSASEVLSWLQGHPCQGGDVVLMHDNHPFAAEVLPDFIEAVRRRGLGFATVTDWLR